MPTPIRTALCSFGMSGRVFHGPLLSVHPDFELVSVWQRSKSDAAEAYPGIRIERSLQALLGDDKIDLVIVNTPGHTHFDFALKALEAGKHVIVEKAFTSTVEEADELIRLAKNKGLLLSVFQNRRWDSDFLSVKQVIDSGELGRMVEYEVRYDRYRTEIKDSWKEVEGPGNGIMYNLGSHIIDQVLVLFGLPKWIWADLDIQRTGGKVADHFQIVMGYPDKKVNLGARYLSLAPQPKYKIWGELGSYIKYGEDPQEAALASGKAPNEEEWGKEDPSAWGEVTTAHGADRRIRKIESPAGNYLRFYDQISAVMRGQQSEYVTAEQARDVIRIIRLAYHSDKEGRRIEL